MPLRIAITGASGMVGSAISLAFLKEGHHVVPLIRPSTPIKTNRRVIRWDFEREKINLESLENFDAVIHLAGANIADRRWTKEYKTIIKMSRVKSTAFLSKMIASLKNPPNVFVSASAVGFYGHSPLGEKKDESMPRGQDFLAEVCEEWENATQTAKLAGIRVVTIRMGMILSKTGGALGKMLPVFKLGLGGKIGQGNQAVSWISLKEVPAIINHIIQRRDLSGPVNCVSPVTISNEEFTKTLGKILRRPTVLPFPSFAARLLFGEMAESLLLGGAEVVPAKLLDSGYAFRYPDLKSAFANILLKNH